MNEDEDGIIKVNTQIFLDYLEKSKDIDYVLPIHIINKAQELQSEYNCFSCNYDARSLWEKKKFIAARSKNKEKLKAKPIIFNSDYSDETKNKKEFMGLLNKLTDCNKDLIYSKLKLFIENIKNNQTLVQELFEIIWVFIKKSSNIIYIEILYLFDNELYLKMLNNYWNNYLEKELWKPELSMYNNNIMSNDEHYYDEFCEFVKWKKSSISVIRAFIYIFKKENKLNNIDILLNNLLKIVECHMNKSEIANKHILNITLEQLYTILDLYKNENILNIIKSWNKNNFESSSKFKLYNILELE